MLKYLKTLLVTPDKEKLFFQWVLIIRIWVKQLMQYLMGKLIEAYL